MNRREALKSLCVLVGSVLLPGFIKIAPQSSQSSQQFKERTEFQADQSLQAGGWTWDKSGLMSHSGQSFFPTYAPDGSLMTGLHSGVFSVYYYRGNGVVECELKTYLEIKALAIA